MKPVIFDRSKSVRFDALKVGDLFVTIDAHCGNHYYSERIYCKTRPFDNGDGWDSYNAIGVSEKYTARMATPDRVIKLDIDYNKLLEGCGVSEI